MFKMYYDKHGLTSDSLAAAKKSFIERVGYQPQWLLVRGEDRAKGEAMAQLGNMKCVETAMPSCHFGLGTVYKSNRTPRIFITKRKPVL